MLLSDCAQSREDIPWQSEVCSRHSIEGHFLGDKYSFL